MPKQMTFGVIVGNRGFFPGPSRESGREEMLAAIENSRAIERSRPQARGDEVRRGRIARRSQAVRRPLQASIAKKSTASS